MTLECKVRTLYMNPDDLKRCAGCDKSNIEDILLEESAELIPSKAVAGLGYLCPECYQEETNPTPAELAALVADLNAIIAQQEARLRSQESQISEMYAEIVALKAGNRTPGCVLPICKPALGTDRCERCGSDLATMRASGEPCPAVEARWVVQ